MTATDRRDDLPTVVALAALAICTTALAHEAFGHGSVCMLLGGHVTLLTNAYFHCSAHSYLIDAGGPAGNLLVGAMALLLSRLVPGRRPALRFYLLCVAAFSLYWEAGYLIFSMLHAHGDYYQAATGLFGLSGWPMRIGGVAIGVAAYCVFMKLLAPGLAAIKSPRSPRVALIVGVAVMAVSAALYAPDRLGAMHDAALSAAAAFPLLFRRTPTSPSADPIARSALALAAGLIAVAAFALTMGRGLNGT